MKHPRLTQSGSVLFIIMIAIALFAALTYALTRGNQGNQSQLTEQQAKIAAQEIISYGNTVADAVQKLKLRGCTDTEISFENDVAAGYENSLSPPDKSCHIFDAAGGMLTLPSTLPSPIIAPNDPSSPWRTHGFIGDIAWSGVGTVCSDPSCTELVMITHRLTEDICRQTNALLGYTAPLLVNSQIGGGPFKGAYTATDNVGNEAGDSEAEGKTAGCFLRENNSDYIYLQVLISR